MKHRGWTTAGVSGVVVLGLLLSGCAQTPLGPTVQVMPGPEVLRAFTYDQAGCKQFAESAVAGQAQNANNRAVGAAAIGTVLGAGLGAAIGGGRGAAIGAGSGAIAGTGSGMGSSSERAVRHPAAIRQRLCPVHVSKGNMVPGLRPDDGQCAAAAAATARTSSLTAAVQQQLIRLGYLHGAADGVAGPQTSFGDQPVRERLGTAGGRHALAAVAGTGCRRRRSHVGARCPSPFGLESAYLEVA